MALQAGRGAEERELEGAQGDDARAYDEDDPFDEEGLPVRGSQEARGQSAGGGVPRMGSCEARGHRGVLNAHCLRRDGGRPVGVVVGQGGLSGRAPAGGAAHGHEDDDPGQPCPREGLRHPFPGDEMPQERQRPRLVAQLRVPGDQGEEQQGEGHHDQPVGGLDPRTALELAVGQRGGDNAPEAPADGAQAPGVGRARGHGAPHVRQAPRECHERDRRDEQRERPHNGAERRIGHRGSSLHGRLSR